MFKPRNLTGTRELLATFATLAVSSGLAAQTLTIDGEVFRDPTQPLPIVLTMQAAEVLDVGGPEIAINNTNYVVSFVRTGGSRPVAVINDRQLTIGDNVDGAEIVDIRNGEVVLSAAGRDYVLTAFTRSIREPIE
ncbi:hypothetical protein QGM61_02600 [Pseudohongiella sp. SYSU M77423]|uniref:hypothetical protein n=1 Tax=Pseudohongiella sp. SYSU M77423 TaxID=3042312 RepID=UPI0024801803|nr:hypothetical protein [Pseudohongiella sp. SYSU M77423]MDH7942698.1 hypothetical protein [Pseudohongiella sp. SYSU M77423]